MLTSQELKLSRIQTCVEYMRERFAHFDSVVAAYVSSGCETACCIDMRIYLKEFDEEAERAIVNAELTFDDVLPDVSLNGHWIHLEGRSLDGFITPDDILENDSTYKRYLPQVWIKKPENIKC